MPVGVIFLNAFWHGQPTPYDFNETVHNLGGLMRLGETGDGPCQCRSKTPQMCRSKIPHFVAGSL